MVFVVSKIIRFSHVDPAGIVFYPRYAEFCSEVVEDWFRSGLGVSIRRLMEDEMLTIPTVRLEIEYLSPSYHEDVLEFSLCVANIGGSSLSLNVVVACLGEIRAKMFLTVVFVECEAFSSVPIPEHWRKKFLAFK